MSIYEQNMRQIRIIHNTKLQEFIRFCIVGVLATGIHYGIYLAMLRILSITSELGINISYTIGYIIGFLANLFLSAYFTFKTKITIQKSLGFVVTNVINYGLHLAFLNLFLWIGISDEWAPIPTFCCVIPTNFILVRTVFKKFK